MPATHVPEVARIGQSSRGTAGVYELQLRRKLLQQQLGVVDERCQRVAKVVAKKHLARLSRQENTGQRPVPGRDVADRRRKFITNPGGLPSIGVTGVGGGGGIREHDNIGVTGGRPATTDKAAHQGRDASQHKQDFLTAAPFKKGGCIDHTRKKQMLQDKQREIERQAALEKKMRPGKKGLSVRDEVAAAPSAFPDRYLRGEVPCSKHCSAGKMLTSIVGVFWSRYVSFGGGNYSQSWCNTQVHIFMQHIDLLGRPYIVASNPAVSSYICRKKCPTSTVMKSRNSCGTIERVLLVPPSPTQSHKNTYQVRYMLSHTETRCSCANPTPVGSSTPMRVCV